MAPEEKHLHVYKKLAIKITKTVNNSYQLFIDINDNFWRII